MDTTIIWETNTNLLFLDTNTLRMKIRTIICMLFVPAFILQAHPDMYWSHEVQNISVLCLNTENGLSHAKVTASYRDELGRVWIGTDDGLNRYDGNKIDIFRPDGKNSITTNAITGLCGDGQGHLYIKGRQSLSVLDFRNMQFSVLEDTDVRAVCFRNGILYYVCANEVFSCKPSGENKIKTFTYTPKHNEVITDICIDLDGAIYLSLSSDELMKINSDRRISSFKFTDIHKLSLDADGNVWVASRSEGFRMISPEGVWKHYKFSNRDPNAKDWNNARDIVQIGPNEYFIGTYGGLALLETNTGKLTRYDYEPGVSGFKSKSVSNLHFSDDILFIGTFHAGLHYYIIDNNIYKTYGTSKQDNTGLSSPIVSSIVKDRRNVLWVGTVSGGLNIIDPENKISNRLKLKLTNEYLTNIKHLYYDEKEDAIYASMFSEGVCRIDPVKSEIRKASPVFYDKKSGRTLVNQNITRLITIDDTYSLLLTLDGVVKLNKKKMVLESLITKGMQNAMIRDIALDNDSNLWIASGNSLICMSINNPDEYRLWMTSEIQGMSPEGLITSISVDRNGRIWMGSSGSGLFQIDNAESEFRHWSTADGLTNGYINDITQSKVSDRIYLATNEGVTSLDLKTGSFDNYNMSNGFPLTTTDRLYTSSDSTLYACDINGITAINENSLKNRRKDYKIFISDIYINNSKVDYSDGSPLVRSTLFQDDMELSGDISSLSFDITNSSLDPLLKTAFEYSLEGFDEGFITARGNHITYTNLSVGKYTLILRGTIPQSNGEYPETRISITIYPPFWKSWWFVSILTLICLALALIYVLNYLRNSKLRTLLEIEKREKEHEKKLAKSKAHFLTNISHEFRTPLTLINSHVEILMQKNSLEPEVYNNVLGAYRNTQKLREMVDEFIDFNRTDTTETSLMLLPYSANNLVNEIYILFKDYAESRGIRYSFNPCKNDPWISVDYSQLSRAVTNLVSNAFKYTHDEITISIESNETTVSIKVMDNGVGIEKKNLKKIFERFWQEDRANEASSVKGSGIGLSYADDIINRHGGKISVESTPDISTVFNITLDRCEAIDINMTVCSTDDKENTLSEADIPQQSTTVLIVEDNHEVMQVLKHIFEPYYNIITANNGHEGLEKAAKLQPELIISDVMMPIMSGIEMCHMLKSNFATSHIPIILLTALGTEAHTLEGLNNGADDYVTKPFNSKILLARCSNLIKSRMSIQEHYTHDASATVQELTSNPVDIKLLSEAVTIIEANINDNDFDILFFARQLCLSRTQLFKKIKSLTGMTPNMFVLSIKLKRASQEILAHPDENIANIAYRCGFNTPSYFIKCFKKFYGMTPLAFRKKEGMLE